MARSIVSVWHGCYLLERGAVVDERRVPPGPEALAERLRLRAEGRRTTEEEALLADRRGAVWTTRDRRLVGDGVVLDPAAPADRPTEGGISDHRAAVLAEAERALLAAWDPSVHLEEAVRTLRDADRALNLLGERLAGWAAHDHPGVDAEDPVAAARELTGSDGPARFGPEEPALRDARRRFAELYTELRAARATLEQAVSAAAPDRTPNLAALLGAELASRLVAQAGGLDRLARMPASTVQVLGAEKAFFEHLRGRAPPPRHGLLFLHPSIQSAPRTQRGRLARTLAGKAAIAARLDHEGREVDPALKNAYERRREALRAARERTGPSRRRRDSRPPFDRAAENR